MRVLLDSPLGETKRLYGFWDGAKVWKVRFKPGVPGTWRYYTMCSDTANAGLHGKTGEFLCTAPDTETRFSQHGPVQVAREMRRVCRPGGKIIILNHFRSANPILSRMERAISPFTVHIGFKADLDLPGFLAQAELAPISVEKVNVPRIWSLVTCIKD